MSWFKKSKLDEKAENFGKGLVTGSAKIVKGFGGAIKQGVKDYKAYSAENKKNRLSRLREENRVLREQVKQKRLKEKLKGKGNKYDNFKIEF